MFNFSVRYFVLVLPSENSPSRESNNTLSHHHRPNLQTAHSTPLLIKTASINCFVNPLRLQGMENKGCGSCLMPF